MTISKPRKKIVPMADGLAWRSPDFLCQEKADGVFAVMELPGVVLTVEKMRLGPWQAFDCVGYCGEDIRDWPLRERWRLLVNLGRTIEAHGGTIVATGPGGEFLRAVLARGGEGIVAKRWDSAYGDMVACKRVQTFLCRVTAFRGGTNAVAVCDAATGQPRGKVPLRSGKADRCRVGSILKLEAFGEHPSGLLREARPCADSPDSWLVQY